MTTVSLSALTGSDGFRLEGVAPEDRSGFPVSGAGDVNGDGFEDVVMGAAGASTGARAAGAAYVVFGRPEGFAASVNLSTLDGTNGFRLAGTAVDDFAGFSASGAGDVNGDGFADLIVGAHGSSPNGAGSGSAYVIFGSSAGYAASMDLSTLDGTNGFRLVGVATGDSTGFSVSGAGDINGDGFADVIVGAPFAGGSALAGAGYVLYGRAFGFSATIDLAALDGTVGFKLVGAAGDQAGVSVSAAGDVNGDRVGDLVIGAPFAGPNGIRSGLTYVVFGRTSGFEASVDLAGLDGTSGFQVEGAAILDFSGVSVSAAGDVNGDGYDDLIIGAPFADSNGFDAGAAYVVFGGSSGFAAGIDLAALNGTNGFRLTGSAEFDNFGFWVSGAGDVNGDGFHDLIVGAPQADVAGANSGAGYLILGRQAGFAPTINVSILDGTNGLRLAGAAPEDSAATSVSGAGDVNGDGFGDIMLGAYQADPNGSFSGASYVVFGGDFNGAVGHLGTNGADALNGTAAAESFVAGLGNDTLFGGEGNDALSGGAGRDTALYGGGRDAYTVGRTISGYVVAGPDGRDTLAGIERVQFQDRGLALDLVLNAAAGNTVRIIGAAFGADAITPEYVGIGLELFDVGTSVQDVCGLVLQVMGSPGNEAFVNAVYTNVVGIAPQPDELAAFVGLLQGSGGTMTQAELLIYAANSELNAQNIHLVGLLQVGVEYA
jgi:hypothetical protein